MPSTDELRDQDAETRRLSAQLPQDARPARRRQIAELVVAAGSIRSEDPAERLDIDLTTAHHARDGRAERGLLRQFRGRVSAAPTGPVEASDVDRPARPSAGKAAPAAARLIAPDQAILMVEAASVGPMAPPLADKRP
jgi:DeoR/GlpR family transcriptional regulator of sugar metabolism